MRTWRRSGARATERGRGGRAVVQACQRAHQQSWRCGGGEGVELAADGGAGLPAGPTSRAGTVVVERQWRRELWCPVSGSGLLHGGGGGVEARAAEPCQCRMPGRGPSAELWRRWRRGALLSLVPPHIRCGMSLLLPAGSGHEHWTGCRGMGRSGARVAGLGWCCELARGLAEGTGCDDLIRQRHGMTFVGPGARRGCVALRRAASRRTAWCEWCVPVPGGPPWWQAAGTMFLRCPPEASTLILY